MAKKTLDSSADQIPYHSEYLAKLCNRSIVLQHIFWLAELEASEKKKKKKK